YTLETGAQSLGYGLLFQTYYILHTGASWRGPIGRAEILVTFAPEAVPTPIHLTALRSLKEQAPSNFNRRRNTVIWDGAVRPTVKGRTLRFVRSGWDPSEKDDVALFFGFLTQAEVNRWYEKQDKG
ncbi:MAG: DUF4424 domain-containing protein, partial [Armatimonadota bacterium]|nr:DUF4424 domain-containing protein [Armatimonadota bacterium]